MVRLGKKLSDIYEKIDRDTFDWRWVLAGVVFIVVSNVVAYLAMRGLINHLILQERVLAAAGVMASGALLVYFLGGVLVGRMSKGHTIREPAVAAVLALVIVFIIQLAAGMFNLVGLVVGAPICFGVAYLGGILGEKWQDRARG
jgi:hypothetical protein